MTSSPQPLPSLPPSPGLEPAPALRRNDEDIAQAWHEDEDTITDARHLNPNAKRRSRKGKERAAESDEDDEDEDEPAAVAGYPPTKEEEESRRVQEVRPVACWFHMHSRSSDCAKTYIMLYASRVAVRSEARGEPRCSFALRFVRSELSLTSLNSTESAPLGNRRTPEAEGCARVRVCSPYKYSGGSRQ